MDGPTKNTHPGASASSLISTYVAADLRFKTFVLRTNPCTGMVSDVFTHGSVLMVDSRPGWSTVDILDMDVQPYKPERAEVYVIQVIRSESVVFKLTVSKPSTAVYVDRANGYAAYLIVADPAGHTGTCTRVTHASGAIGPYSAPNTPSAAYVRVAGALTWSSLRAVLSPQQMNGNIGNTPLEEGDVALIGLSVDPDDDGSELQIAVAKSIVPPNGMTTKVHITAAVTPDVYNDFTLDFASEAAAGSVYTVRRASSGAVTVTGVASGSGVAIAAGSLPEPSNAFPVTAATASSCFSLKAYSVNSAVTASGVAMQTVIMHEVKNLGEGCATPTNDVIRVAESEGANFVFVPHAAPFSSATHLREELVGDETNLSVTGSARPVLVAPRLTAVGTSGADGSCDYVAADAPCCDNPRPVDIVEEPWPLIAGSDSVGHIRVLLPDGVRQLTKTFKLGLSNQAYGAGDVVLFTISVSEVVTSPLLVDVALSDTPSISVLYADSAQSAASVASVAFVGTPVALAQSPLFARRYHPDIDGAYETCHIVTAASSLPVPYYGNRTLLGAPEDGWFAAPCRYPLREALAHSSVAVPIPSGTDVLSYASDATYQNGITTVPYWCILGTHQKSTTHIYYLFALIGANLFNRTLRIGEGCVDKDGTPLFALSCGGVVDIFAPPTVILAPAIFCVEAPIGAAAGTTCTTLRALYTSGAWSWVDVTGTMPSVTASVTQPDWSSRTQELILARDETLLASLRPTLWSASATASTGTACPINTQPSYIAPGVPCVQQNTAALQPVSTAYFGGKLAVEKLEYAPSAMLTVPDQWALGGPSSDRPSPPQIDVLLAPGTLSILGVANLSSTRVCVMFLATDFVNVNTRLRISTAGWLDAGRAERFVEFMVTTPILAGHVVLMDVLLPQSLQASSTLTHSSGTSIASVALTGSADLSHPIQDSAFLHVYQTGTQFAMTSATFGTLFTPSTLPRGLKADCTALQRTQYASNKPDVGSAVVFWAGASPSESTLHVYDFACMPTHLYSRVCSSVVGDGGVLTRADFLTYAPSVVTMFS